MPVKQGSVKSEFKPWVTSEIKHLSHHRDYLKRQAELLDCDLFTMKSLKKNVKTK